MKYVLAQRPKQHCSGKSLELSFHFSKKEFGHAYVSILKRKLPSFQQSRLLFKRNFYNYYLISAIKPPNRF